MYASFGTPGLDNQSNWRKMAYYWGYIVRTIPCGKLIASYTRNCLQANVSVNSESQYKINRYTEHEKKVQLWFNVKHFLCDDPEGVKDFTMNFFLIIKFKSNDRKETSSTFHQVLLISHLKCCYSGHIFIKRFRVHLLLLSAPKENAFRFQNAWNT